MAAVIDKTRKQVLHRRLVYGTLVAPNPRQLARELGINNVTAYKWLSEAGVDFKSATVRCPSCEEAMERGDLFFWRCTSCGAEWWPPDSETPANPDAWAVRYGTLAPETVNLMDRLRSEGLNYEEIAAHLNEAGIPSPRGVTWSRRVVNHYLAKHAAGKEEEWRRNRPRVLELVRAMASEGISADRIAERLNVEGIPTRTGLEWTRVHVHNFLKRARIRIARNRKAVPTGVGSTGPKHPWVIDRERMYAGIKAWRSP